MIWTPGKPGSYIYSESFVPQALYCLILFLENHEMKGVVRPLKVKFLKLKKKKNSAGYIPLDFFIFLFYGSTFLHFPLGYGIW